SLRCSSRRSAPISTLFPYTTLFRSASRHLADGGVLLHRVARPAIAGAGDARLRGGVARGLRRSPRRRGPAPARSHHSRQRPHGSDRKSTRLNSSHVKISYAVYCLKK